MTLFINQISINDKIPSEDYINLIPCVNKLKTSPLIFNKAITIIVGDNGAGKSTLMEGIAIALGFNPEGGTRNFNFKTNDTHSDLYKYLTISRKNNFRDGFFLRAESFYNVASNIDSFEDDLMLKHYGNKSLHNQSHGESFIALVKNRFSPNGLYLLDEPEAALSPTRILELLCMINDLEKQGSQFIIATHSPIIMTYPNASIIKLDEEGFSEIDYQETDHYRITKEFINNPGRMYNHLFND